MDFSEKMYFQKVQHWFTSGWEIGLHGYDHVLRPIKRDNQIFKLNKYSEFCGLDFTDQYRKVVEGLEIFKRVTQ